MSHLEQARKLHQVTWPAAQAKAVAVRERRDREIYLAHTLEGLTYQQIADVLGVTNPTIQTIVQRENGTPSPSRVKETRK